MRPEVSESAEVSPVPPPHRPAAASRRLASVPGMARLVAVMTVVVAGFLAVAPLSGQEQRYGDILLQRLPSLPEGKTHGYHEYLFEVENLNSQRPREVLLRFPGVGLSGRAGLSAMEATLRVEPSSTKRLSVLQPDLPISGQDLAVFIDGKRQTPDFPWFSEHPVGQIQISGRYTGPQVAMRLLEGRHTDRRRIPRITDQNRSALPIQYELLHPDTPLTQWSEHWLAYSGYDGIVLTWSEMRSAPTGVTEALWSYVEAGGNLLLLKTPDDVMTAVLGPAAQGTSPRIGGRALAGLRHHDPVPEGEDPDDKAGPSAPQATLDPLPDLAWQYMGLGELLLASDRPQEFSTESMERLAAAWQRTHNPWQADRSTQPGQRFIPVVTAVAVPMRGLFALVLVFALLVGPINLWWVNRRKRRLWLLWTVPLLSLVACLLVVSVAIFGEGIRQKSRSFGLTVLDQAAQRATTLAWSGYYSSLATDGLRFSRHTEVAVLGGGNNQRRIALGAEQHLSSGWLAPRLPSYFIERRHDRHRERLEVTWRGDDVLVVNGLGCELDWLVVADGAGRTFRSQGPVLPGAQAVLTLQGQRAEGGPRALRELYREDLPVQLHRAKADPSKILRPSTYLAATRGGGPFLENALAKAQEPQLDGVVYGLLEVNP